MAESQQSELRPLVQPFLPLFDEIWIETRDGNDAARAIFDRHYSRRRYRDGRKNLLFVAPGEKLVLLTVDARALFVWNKFYSMDKQTGVSCAVFRNEGPILSSDLIRAADEIAWSRWPKERRHYTYVNPRKIRSTNPGYCFLKAGWRHCGVTKHRGLLILERVR